MQSLNDVKRLASMSVARTGINYAVIKVKGGFRFMPAARYFGSHELLLKKGKDKVLVFDKNGKKLDSIDTKRGKIEVGSKKDSGNKESKEAKEV